MTTAPHLVLVTPDTAYESFHDWLSSEKGMDRVHQINGREELLARRLGGANSNKRCYAHVDGQGSVLSVIYTYWAKAEQTDKPWKILPGKIGPILSAQSEPLTVEPDIVTFYSISSFVDRSGRPLIKSIYSEFTKAANPPVLTTLSPLRTLKAWLDNEGIKLSGTKEEKLEIVTRYLKLNVDPVQKFHLGNGAQVGAIHFNAAEKGSPDDTLGAGVMVSYRYPRQEERLAQNRAVYKEGQIPSSYHLLDYLRA